MALHLSSLGRRWDGVELEEVAARLPKKKSKGWFGGAHARP